MECLKAFESLGYECPIDYNPADLIIETLAVEPGNEDHCKERIRHICDSFDESETGKGLKEKVDREASQRDPIDGARKLSPFYLQVMKMGLRLGS